MYSLTQEELKEELLYEPDTGNFYWLADKQGRDTTRPAGTRNLKGYRSINVNGIIYSQNRLAWYYQMGTWPDQEVGYKDGNPNNIRWNNLMLISNNERLHNYKKKNEVLNNTTVVVHRGDQRAHFSEEEVTQAVEEFIRDKVLVGGRYVTKG